MHSARFWQKKDSDAPLLRVTTSVVLINEEGTAAQEQIINKGCEKGNLARRKVKRVYTI